MQLQVGVKVLIENDQGELLFLRRRVQVSTGSNETSWDIPGGRINADEKLDNALVREVEEEIGYTLTSTPMLIAAQDIMVPVKELHVVRLTYLAKENVSKVALSDEHDEYQWLPLGEVYSITTEPYLAEVLGNLTSIANPA